MSTTDTTTTSAESLPSAFDAPRPQMREIKDLDAASLCARMRLGLEHFDPRVVELSQDQVSQAWLEDAGVGVWPIRVLVGHLADTEIVLAQRIRKIIAEDNPELALWDEHAFIDGEIYGCTEGSTLLPPMGGDLAMIHTTRNWLCALLMQLDDAHWQRQGIHPINGPMTAREIANYNCYHLEHHAWFLNAKIEKLLGPAPIAEPCGDGGCGKPSCGCR